MTDELEYTLFKLFCLGTGLLFFILLSIESYVTRHFQPDIFRVGVRIYRENLLLPEPEQPPGSVFETESGRFKAIGPGQCLFFNRSGFLSKWGGLRGSLQWTENWAMAVVRIPVYQVLPLVALLTFNAVFYLIHWPSMTRSMGTLGFVLLMLVIWVPLGALVGRWISTMKREAESILAEYEKYVTGQHGEAWLPVGGGRATLTGSAADEQA